MLARVATFDQLTPDDLDSDAVQRLRDIVRNTPGYVAGFHLHDPKTSKGMSIIVLEGPEAAKAMGEALGRRPEDQRIGINPDHVEFLQAESF